MATRTLKFKLIVPRSDSADARQARCALWQTHAFVNEAVAFYERLLLEMRQDDVLVRSADGPEHIEGGEVWRQRLRDRLLTLGRSPELADLALPCLRRIYEDAVKSSVKPGTGSAQDGRTYHSALVDPQSQAGASRRQKLAALDPLRPLLDRPSSEWEHKARRIVEAHRDQLLAATGAPPRWVRLFKDNHPDWADALASYLKKELGAGGAFIDPLQWLQENGVLPIAEPVARGRLRDDKQLSTFERMSLAKAVAHLNSWESWSHRTRAQYEQRRAKLQEWENKHGDACRAALARIRQFEAHRAQRLEEESFWAEGSTYRVRPRELRGWRELRDWLQKHPGASVEARVDKVHDIQREMGRSFGSEITLRWLAQPDQQWLADSPQDVVSFIALYNRLTDLVERTRPLPLYTPPDARLHPQWAGFDPPNNSNQPPFTLRTDEQGRLTLSLELLAPSDDGRLDRRQFSFRLAPSRQFTCGSIRVVAGSAAPAKRALLLDAEAQDRLSRVAGQIGGSDLLFERTSMATRELGVLAAGNIGTAFLKVAADLAEPGAEERLRAHRKQATWIKSGLDKRRAATTPLAPGFRALAVDLGLRSAAAVSVFELEGADPRSVPPGAPTVAGCRVVHERSALLKLPGEDPTDRERESRQRRAAELRGVRAAMSILWKARRLHSTSGTDERTKLLEALLTSDLVGRADPDLRDAAEGLRAAAGLPMAAWQPRAEVVFLGAERLIGDWMAEWRRQTRPRQTHHMGGKSIWKIEHLETVRRVLLGWHRHQRPRDRAVRRLDRATMGTVASHLLRHLNALKDDRVKTTADLIIQAARGLVYAGGAWVQRHKPVDVIILEDLTRYLSRTDRPPAENRQLMRWAHREVNKTVGMQAEGYGIATLDTSARYSSRFDALTRAPGVRCTQASRDLVSFLRGPASEAMRTRLRRLGIDAAAVQVGDHLPLGTGELLASLDGPEKLRILHADLNAAQNLAVWALEGYAEPVRVVATRVSEVPLVYAAADLGRRLAAAFGGEAVVLKPVDVSRPELDLIPYPTWKAAATHLGLAATQRPAGGDGESEAKDYTDVLVAELAELEAELTGDRHNLFRDPSKAVFGGRWVESRVYWPFVEREVVRRLRASGRLHG